MADDTSTLDLTLKLDIATIRQGGAAAGSAASNFDRLQDSIRKTKAQADDLNKTIKLPRLDLGPVGPAQAFQRAQMQYKNAQAAGSPRQQFDAALNLQRKQEAFLKAQRASIGDSSGSSDTVNRIGNLIKSTRFETGKDGATSFMPLIGRAAAVLGPTLGPFGIALGAAVSAVKLFDDAIKAARSAALNFSQIQSQTGSGPLDAARFGVLADFLDVKPEQMAGMARQHAQALQTNPFAQQMFGRVNLPGPFGAINQADMLMKDLEKLRSFPRTHAGDVAATRAAREGGIEPLLAVRNASDQSFHAMMRAAAMHGDMMDRGYTRAALTDKAWRAAGDQAFASQYIDPYEKALALQGGGDMMSPMHRAGSRPDDPSIQTWGGQGLGGGSAASVIGPMADAIQENTQAQRAATAALDRNAMIMRDMNRHLYGGGERGRDASPAKARYTNMDNFLYDSRLQMGQL